MKIIITNNGFRGKGIYIGRPSIWGNPFPVKKSKYSDKIYSLKASLEKYKIYFEKRLKEDERFRTEFNKLLKILKVNKCLVLDCFCTNKVVSSINDINLDSCIYHGEIIAYFLFKNFKKVGQL